MHRAMGFMAGPESPPLTLDRTGFRSWRSMAIPGNLLMRDIMWAPARATATATLTMSATLGVSLTITGRDVADLAAAVTSAAVLGSLPNSIPPAFTLGQLMLTSMPLTPGTLSSLPASLA